MIKNILLFTLAAATVAQAAEAPDVVARRVADNVLRNTSFQVLNKKTGDLHSSTQGLAYSVDVVAESPYNQWEYWNGVLAIGMIRLTESVHEQKYAEYAQRNYRFIFDNLDYFKQQYAAGVKGSFFQYFNLRRLDDCGAMAAGLIDVYGRDPQPAYRSYLDRVGNYILKKQERLPNGTLAREVPRNMTLWADDLYMSVPYLARMAKLSGNSLYLDDAIRQVEQFTQYLYNPAVGLSYHCWYSDVEMNGVAYWGRCNGWLMMAQVELLGQMPKDHPKRAGLIRLLQRQISGISRYQDISGLWHQVLDRPDSYLESSCTAMFVYSIARAVNEGWIARSYLSIAQNGWDGLLTKIDAEGRVADICIGTGIRDDIKFYYTRPTKLNDIHGLGAVLLAGVEMARVSAN